VSKDIALSIFLVTFVLSGSSHGDHYEWANPAPKKVASLGGATLDRLKDGSFLATGKNADTDTYVVMFPAAKRSIHAVRLEALTHPTLTGGSTGRGSNGNFVLSEIEISAASAKEPNVLKPVKVVAAQADYQQTGWPVASAIDGKIGKGGWGVDGHLKRENRTAVFTLAEPIPPGSIVRIRLIQEFGGGHQFGRFRISFSPHESAKKSLANYEVPDPSLELTRIDQSEKESFLSVHVDTEGRLFVGAREAVFAYDPDGKGGFKPPVELHRFPPNTWVYDFAIRGNDLYVQTTTVTYVLPQARIKREGISIKPLLWGLPTGSVGAPTYGVHQGFHGLDWGPEGDLYVSFGDTVWNGGAMAAPNRWGHSYFYTADGKKVPFNGTGGIVRIRPDGTHVRTVATGLRNPCGLAFDRDWNLFTHDNDHESLPAQFIPGRLLHVTDGADFSWPRGWMVTKSPDRKDLLKTMYGGMGRTIPVGQSYYDESLLPAKYRDNILLARWGQRTLTAYPKWSSGATFQAREQVLISCRDMARPVGVAVGPSGRVFVAICFMNGNSPSPIYRSELLVLAPKKKPAKAPRFVDVVAADVETLYRHLSSPSWHLRHAVHVELLRRGGAALNYATRHLKTTSDDSTIQDDPALQHHVYLCAASKSDAALAVLKKLCRHPNSLIRLHVIRALVEHAGNRSPQSLFVESIKDTSATVQLAALQAQFHFDKLPPEVIQGPARSDDTYLRQTATHLMAEKMPVGALEKLRQSTDARIRLAAVLAAGRQLTVPRPDFVPPAELPLGGTLGPRIYLDRKVVDLTKIARIGHFYMSAHWKLVSKSKQQGFDLLMKSLDDEDETVRLQAAFFLSLLNDERSRAGIVKVRNEATEVRLALAKPVPITQIWMCGPFSDAGAKGSARKSLDRRHAPEIGTIDVAATYGKAASPIRWKKLNSPNGDYSSQVKPQSFSHSVYAMFVIESPVKQRAWLQLTILGDGIVRQNGRSVWHRSQGGASGETAGKVVLDLEPGSNQILVRCQPDPRRILAMNLRVLGRIAVTVPEPQDISLADRLKSATGGQSKLNLDEFLKVDWRKATKEGNVASGRKLFTSIGCAKCHAVTGSVGVTGGPSLADVGRRFSPDYLVESILLPSKKISEFFRSSTLVTADGKILTGLITAETDTEIQLMLSDAKRIRIQKEDIDQRRESSVSAMPQGLIKTTQELKDVLSYLVSDVSDQSTALTNDLDTGWTDLLAGDDLSRHWTTSGNWRLGKDGVVKLVPRKGESGWGRFDAYLWHNRQLKDFEIDFEYKVQAGGNSGFYFRVADKKNPVNTGIEVQIYDTARRGKAPVLNVHDAGGIIPFGILPKANAAKPAGEWNRFQIAVRDNQLTVKLNGQLVNEAALDQGGFKTRLEKGSIGFQDHGLPLELRKLRIRGL